MLGLHHISPSTSRADKIETMENTVLSVCHRLHLPPLSPFPRVWNMVGFPTHDFWPGLEQRLCGDTRPYMCLRGHCVAQPSFYSPYSLRHIQTMHQNTWKAHIPKIATLIPEQTTHRRWTFSPFNFLCAHFCALYAQQQSLLWSCISFPLTTKTVICFSLLKHVPRTDFNYLVMI